jgi:aryl-alcohol dehydrogenase-like predicted oxidoreductase
MVGSVLHDVERRRFGGSDLEITPVGIGTAPIGSVPGLWWVNWGPQDENESVRAIHAALDAGVNWIDTAPFYGWGRAEEVVGRAIRGRECLVFTKCGTMRRDDGDDYMDLSPQTTRADVEGSLQRLRVEQLDLLQIHDRDPFTPIEETWGTIRELVAEGKVRHGGISNHRADEVERALAVGPVAGLQYQYNVLWREVEDAILPLALERGLGMIVWSPLASGFLADGFSLDALTPDDFRHGLKPYTEMDLEPLRAALRGDGRTAAQGALAWVLSHPAVTGAIVGIRNDREAAELGLAAELRLTPEERTAIASVAA